MNDTRYLIESKFLTMQQVADQIGISRRTLHRWLSGHNIERHKKIMDAIEKINNEEKFQEIISHITTEALREELKKRGELT